MFFRECVGKICVFGLVVLWGLCREMLDNLEIVFVGAVKKIFEILDFELTAKCTYRWGLSWRELEFLNCFL